MMHTMAFLVTAAVLGMAVGSMAQSSCPSSMPGVCLPTSMPIGRSPTRTKAYFFTLMQSHHCIIIRSFVCAHNVTHIRARTSS
jgi:hypothetical protein